MKVLIVLAVCVAAATAGCPNLSVVTPLSVSDFVGTWYQWASYGSFIFQGPGDCAKAEYTINNDTGLIDVKNSESSLIGDLEIDGVAQLADPTTQAGVLQVTLETLVGDVTSPLSVLDTDYTSFAVLYNCKRTLFWTSDASWIVTRERVPSNTTLAAIEASLATISAQSEDAPCIDDYEETYQGDECDN